MSTATSTSHRGCPIDAGASIVQTLGPTRQAQPRSTDAPVLSNQPLRERYWRLRVHAPHAAEYYVPGQFGMLTATRQVDRAPVLPRPMAIYDADPRQGWVEFVYAVLGAGTTALTTFVPGERVGLLAPLGRGFDLPEGDLLLLGRGIGTCSLTTLTAVRGASGASRAITTVASGRHPAAVLGAELYRTRGARCLSVHDTDGSSDPDNLHQNLRSMLDSHPPATIATCGSTRLRELALRLAAGWDSDVQVALEARMACGLGYCHGCSLTAPDASAEAPLVCRDGPVFRLTTRSPPRSTANA